jgi:hypothetical protein
MKSLFIGCILVTLAAIPGFSQKQDKSGDFFTSDEPLDITLIFNMAKMATNKYDSGRYSARIQCKLSDSVTIDEKVNISFIGNFRKENCYLPPMKLHFKKTNSPQLAPLNSIKLTSCCKPNEVYDQYILREYLIYKMYNLFTDRSFRVRLLNVTYVDSAGKRKSVTQHGFFVEDAKNVAKRNNSTEYKKNLHAEYTEREQMTLVAMFVFFVGNTDWSVSNRHNMKLLRPTIDSMARPYAVPYDFDFSGLVNTTYAEPDPLLNTENVRDRVYRGYPRNPSEIDTTLELFHARKQVIYDMINNFELLNAGSKKGMIQYLDQFYTTASKPKEVKFYFVDRARRN